MRNILVPIDPAQPARTRSAIEEVLRLVREEPATVRLLRVRPRVSGHVAMFFAPQELQALQEDAGAEELQQAQQLLDAAGVPYTSSVRVGRSASTIVLAARDWQCDRIVFGREQPGLAGRVFGSLAPQVRQLSGAGGEWQVIGS
jgi:nucleotide-binding universal stress UspA family protein